MLRSLFSAFLMYSRIPAPRVEWCEENRRYALGWFPLIGGVIGFLLAVWRQLCIWLNAGAFLFAAGAVLLPVLVTGGIHLDGFCDVCDARASCADRKKRLAILSDPHIGSFAVIKVCLYLIVQTALLTQADSMRTVTVIACSYVISRALSAVTAVTFRAAKKDGSLQSFVRPAHKAVTLCMALGFAAVGAGISLASSLVQAIAAILAALIVLLYHRYASYRDFGGVTGDLCGWFLQMCEIWMLAAAVGSDKLMEVVLCN